MPAVLTLYFTGWHPNTSEYKHLDALRHLPRSPCVMVSAHRGSARRRRRDPLRSPFTPLAGTRTPANTST